MLKPTRNSIVSVFIAFVCASMFCTVAAVAQSDDKTKKTRPRRRSAKSLSKADRSLLKVFAPIAGSASESTVRIQSGRVQIAVGTIVDENGLILTKASEMRGDKLNCRLPNGDVIPAVVFGIDIENDLALLKIDAEGLTVAPLNEVSSEPFKGMWLASPTDHSGSLTVGVVGVAERKIPGSPAFIGIQMMNVRKSSGVRITVVQPKSPAARAKLRKMDVITKIDEFVIKDMTTLRKALGTYSPGSEISLAVTRGDEDLVIRLTLADIQATSEMYQRSRTQNNMGSRLSSRGKDFPLAFQHDTALEAKHCGGPVVDLDGQIVGINIARSGRVSSLAIPVNVVLEVIEKLKSGDYSPTRVYADRIQSSEDALSDVEMKLASGKKEFAESEKGYEDTMAKLEELERMKKEISDRIKEVYDERDELSKKKRVLRSKNSEFDKMVSDLQKKLNAIKAGKKR